MSALPRVLAGGRLQLFLLLLGNGVLQAGLLVGIALLGKQAFDQLETGEGPIAGLFLRAFGLCLLSALLLQLRTAERATAERMGQSYLTATRLLMFDHVNLMPSRTLQKRTRGILMIRFIGDLNALSQWISRGLSQLVVSTLTALLALGILVAISPAVAAGLSILLAIGAAVILAAGPRLFARVRDVRRRRGQMAARLGESLVAASPARMFGRVKGERARLLRQSDKLAAAAVARARLSAQLRLLPDGAMPLAMAFILTLGALGGGSGGTGALFAALLVMNLMISPLRDLTRIFVYRQNYRAARDILTKFLAYPSLAPRGTKLRPFAAKEGRLVFKDVSVTDVFSKVSVEAEPRSLVVVAGQSGSGKSTLLALAARLFDPDEGMAALDGQPLAACDVMSLRAAIGMIGPDLPLVRGSIRRNVTYRAPKATDAQIHAVLDLCGVDGGLLDKKVAEGAADLPAGLRQRLIVARALLGDPILLLIDDADAITDRDARAAIDVALRRRTATALIVSSDPAWMDEADAIWRLEGGKLIREAPGSFQPRQDDAAGETAPRDEAPDAEGVEDAA